VEIVGIERQPELNGRIGDILGFDDTTGRYQVRLAQSLSDGRDAFGLRPAQVALAVGTAVVIKGLQTSEQFNGHMALVTGSEMIAQQYTIQISGGKQLRLSFSNVIC